MSGSQISLFKDFKSDELQSYIKTLNEIKNADYGDFGVFQLQEYATALSDVEASQAALLLSTQGLSTAQIQQTLATQGLTEAQQYEAMTEAGLLKSKQKLTNVELQSNIAKTLSASMSKEEAEAKAQELMSSMNLSVAKEGENAQTVKLTKAKLGELVTEGKLTEAQAQEIAARTGVLIATEAQNALAPKWIANMKAMTIATWDQVKATAVWLATNPAGWAASALLAIGGIVAGMKIYKQHIENIRQSTEEAANTYKESSSSIDDYVSKYQELHKALLEAKGNEEETYNIKKQLLDLQTELNDKFGDEYGKLNLVTNAYKDQTDAIKAYNKEAAQTLLNENRKGIQKAEKEMTKDRHYNLSPVSMSAFTDEGKVLKEIAEQFKDRGVSLMDELGDGSYAQFSVHLNTDAQSAYDTINEFETAIREKAEELGNEHLFDDVLDISSGALNDAKDIIEDWGDIYQESLLANIAKDDSLTSQMNKATKAVQDYNEAVLSSEDPFNDTNVQKAKENLIAVKSEMQNDDGSWNAKWQKYASILEDVFDQADTRLIDFDNAIKNDTSIQELAKKLKGLDDLELQSMADSMGGAGKFKSVAAQFLKVTDSGNEAKQSFAELKEYADKYNVSVDELIEELVRLGYVQKNLFQSGTDTITPPSFIDIESKVQALQEGFDQLDSIYADIVEGGNFDWSSILNNEGFAEAFGDMQNITEDYKNAYDDFVQTISNSPSDIKACQNAFDNLATAYIQNSGILEELTEETKNATIAQLEQMGVTNAEEVVTQALAIKEAELAAQKIMAAHASLDLADATEEQVNAFLDEAGNSELARKELALLALQKELCNENVIKTDADITNLQLLATQAGATAAQIAAIKSVQAQIETAGSGRRYTNNPQDAKKLYENIYNDIFSTVNTARISASMQAQYNGGAKTLKAYENAQKGAGKATKDTTDAIKEQTEALEKQKDALNDSKNELEEIYDAVQWFYDKQIDGIDKYINKLKDANEALEKQKDNYDKILSVVNNVYGDEIAAIQAKIDAINKANDAAEKEIALEKAKQALEEARKRKAIKVYTKHNGYIYTVDENAIKQAEDDLANATEDKLKADLQEQIDLLEQWRDKWNEIPEAFEKAMNEIAAAEKFGPDYKNFILNSDDSDINSFKSEYMGVQSNIADNDAKIDYYEQQKKKIEELKDLWEDAKNAYRDSQYEAKLAAFFGSDYEYQLLNNSASWRMKFANDYSDICSQIEEIENRIKSLSSETSSSISSDSERATNALGETRDTIHGLRDTVKDGDTISKYLWTGDDDFLLASAQTRLIELNRMLENGQTTFKDSGVSISETKNALEDFINEYSNLKSTGDVTDSLRDSLESLQSSAPEYFGYFLKVTESFEERLNNSASYVTQIVEHTNTASDSLSFLNDAISSVKDGSAELEQNVDAVIAGTDATVSGILEKVTSLNDALSSLNTAKTELESAISEEVANADTLVSTSEEKIVHIQSLIMELLSAATQLEASLTELSFQMSQLDAVTFSNVLSAIGFEGSGLYGSIANIISLLNGDEGLITLLNQVNESPLEVLISKFNGEEGLTIAITDVITMISGEEGLIVQINRITETITNIDSVKSAFSNLESQVDGCIGKVTSLNSQIQSLKDKTVTITTVYKTVGSPSGLATGTAYTGQGYASGTAVSGNAGNAYAQGNWGIPYDQKALVGELGKEILLRSGKFFTIDEPQLMDLKKGDIIFNHEQTKAILEKGKSSNINRLKNLGNSKMEQANNLVPYDLFKPGNAFGGGTITKEAFEKFKGSVMTNYVKPDFSAITRSMNNISTQNRTENVTLEFNGDLSFPNITSGNDAQKLVNELMNLSSKAQQRASRR